MKRIIGLYGCSSSGKSTTLRLLIDLFKSEECVNRNGKNKASFILLHKKICIVNCVSTNEDINNACKYFKQQKFDIAIVETKTKGITCKCLAEFAKKEGVKIDWIAKQRTISNIKSVNYNQACDLYKFINNCLIEE